MCRNSELPPPIQRMAFDLEEESVNPRMNCSRLGHLDILKWKEEVTPQSQVQTDRQGREFDPIDRPFCDTQGRILGLQSRVRVSACTECVCKDGKRNAATCSTVAIQSCKDLVTQVGAEAIRIDPACRHQCPQQA